MRYFYSHNQEEKMLGRIFRSQNNIKTKNDHWAIFMEEILSLQGSFTPIPLCKNMLTKFRIIALFIVNGLQNIAQLV